MPGPAPSNRQGFEGATLFGSGIARTSRSSWKRGQNHAVTAPAAGLTGTASSVVTPARQTVRTSLDARIRSMAGPRCGCRCGSGRGDGDGGRLPHDAASAFPGCCPGQGFPMRASARQWPRRARNTIRTGCPARGRHRWILRAWPWPTRPDIGAVRRPSAAADSDLPPNGACLPEPLDGQLEATPAISLNPCDLAESSVDQGGRAPRDVRVRLHSYTECDRGGTDGRLFFDAGPPSHNVVPRGCVKPI